MIRCRGGDGGGLRRSSHAALHARLFFLDSAGREFTPGLAGAVAKAPSARFAPISDSSTGRWDNRPYFVAAHASPQQVVTSAPYLSLTGASLCVTLTIATQRAAKPVVIGTDLDWLRLTEAAPATV